MAKPKTVDPTQILQDIAPQNVPLAEPPSIANYRPADVAGVCCAYCSKFCMTGVRDPQGDNPQGVTVPTGICEQWEANVDGVGVCDTYASGAPAYDENGNEVWEFADSQRVFNEIHFSSDTAAVEEDGRFVVKEILRTGEWPVIPTKKGLIDKPLRVVRDGRSDPEAGIISLSEVIENFRAGAIANPQVPLTDEEQEDHKNLTRLNQGFVRDLWLADGDGTTKLVARMEITEDNTRRKMLNGTYADVSCGIPWRVMSRGREYGTCLEHVCITNKPFIDGLGPFFAASNGDKQPTVIHFATEAAVPKPELKLSYEQLREKLGTAIVSQLNLPSHYTVADINISDHTATIKSGLADTSWTASFKVDDDGESISLASADDWEVVEEEGSQDAPVPEQETSTVPRRSSDDELEAAYRLRELRAPESTQPVSHGERSDMALLTQEELDRLELSDQQRAAFQRILDENAQLTGKTRERDADKRITELEGAGLKERPGALKLYREVMLADDGGPAVVLLSDNGQGKERIGAKDLLDRFIEALKGEDGKVQLSEQHYRNDNPKPPATTEGETEKPVEQRTSEAREALYGNGRK